jgi:hypothetical protein
MLVGTKICHFNIRRFGQAEYQSGETKGLARVPQAGEVLVIELGRVRITEVGHQPPAGMNGTFEVYAEQIEDDGNLPGHREADEDDF